jgi:hypothetical protein
MSADRATDLPAEDMAVAFAHVALEAFLRDLKPEKRQRMLCRLEGAAERLAAEHRDHHNVIPLRTRKALDDLDLRRQRLRLAAERLANVIAAERGGRQRN